MDESYVAFLAALLALLVGLAVGKAWERYKLHEGRWIDRRKARESPHYIVGLNFLVSNQIDQAIDALGRAVEIHGDALEIHLILGNLFREKGQVGRAIQIHQGLLQRPKLTRLEHAYVLLCLGLDFKRGGFVDRALEAFNEVLRLDPDNQYALLNLQKLHEDQQQWGEARAMRQRLMALAGPDGEAASQQILSFLETELGTAAARAGQRHEARQRFEAAIGLDPAAGPARINLGDVLAQEGRLRDAVAAWETVVETVPDRAYLVFDRLEDAYRRLDVPASRFPDLCRRLIARTPHDWRARQALAGHLTGHDDPGGALEVLLEALVHNPHALALHQQIWRVLEQLGLPRAQVDRYVALTGSAVFYLDPHACLNCRYRSTELLWRCPQCHEWNTFVEERIAPAKDSHELPA